MWKSLDVLGISASLDQPALLLSHRTAAHCSNTLQDSHLIFFSVQSNSIILLESSCGLPTDLGSPAFQTSFLLRYKSQSEK